MKTKNTVKTFARHREGCEFTNHGDSRCTCPKYLLVYRADLKRNKQVATGEESWTEAEKQAEMVRDQWDPEKAELRQLRAKKEVGQTPIVDAVSLYTVDLISRLGDNGTVALSRSFFGDVDPNTKEVCTEGHLFSWLASLPAESRPVYIRDITTSHLTNWRASWSKSFKSDVTRAQRWTMVKAFFGFCVRQGWIEVDPARKLSSLKVARGNRTCIFSDDQYTAILDAVDAYDPEFITAAMRTHWQQRIRTFIELLRWSAMDLIDAIEFSPVLVNGNVLRYRRQKTGILATVKLPEHVVVALRSVPLEPGIIGLEKPFRTKGTAQDSNTWKWQHRLGQVFELAGIHEVQTDMRTRKPHCKMLRDTAAVWWLRHGVPIHSVSKALGHSSVTTTEKAYLPWVKELEDSHIEAMDKVMAAAAPKQAGAVVQFRQKRKNR